MKKFVSQNLRVAPSTRSEETAFKFFVWTAEYRSLGKAEKFRPIS